MGVFPSPSSCNNYIVCDSSGSGIQYPCPFEPTYVYDHSTGFCKRRRTWGDCPVINCAIAFNRNRYVVYPPAPRIYFFCGTDTLTLQCPIGNVFNVKTDNCEFLCTSVGRFPHETDPTKYYQCLNAGSNRFTKVESTCPGETIFNGGFCSFQTNTTPSTTTIAPISTTPAAVTSTLASSSTADATVTTLSTDTSLGSSNEPSSTDADASTPSS